MTNAISIAPRVKLHHSVRRIARAINLQLLFWLSLSILGASAALSQQGGARVALVIGNANYQGTKAPLASAVNDARAVADELRRINFDVDLAENIGREKMQSAIAAFISKTSAGSTALFYFSGLGLRSVGENYMIPVDSDIRTIEDVWRHGTGIDLLLSELDRKGAKAKIIIIDAARNNPFESRFRPSPEGLAPSVGTVGTLAIFSTAPGMLIADSTASRSLFVTELLKEFRSTSLSAEEVFNRARIGVARATGNKQVPLVASSLTEEFSFASSQSRVVVARTPTSTPLAAPDPPKTAPTTAPVARQTAAAAVPSQRELSNVSAEPGRVFRDCAECPELVLVPSGSFEMGSTASEREKPLHRVSIASPFALGRSEVTFDEWDKCVEEGGCKRRPDDRGWGRGARPVMNVSWLDAKEYVAWLSKKTNQVYRLPSESEWEYAARAGTNTSFWWGSSVGAQLANCRDCITDQAGHTVPVGSFKPNAFGLFDTAGNVAEWVEDCWHDNYRGAPNNGSAWVEGDCRLRVLRGGSFDSPAAQVQSSARFRYDADVPYSANGFRVVRELR